MNPKLKMALAATLTLWATSAVSQDAVGVVKRANGPAMIERAGTQFPAARGTQLRRGDRIVTGANGYVDITTRGSAVSVGPRANVDLDAYTSSESQSAKSAIPAMLHGLASLLSLNRSR